MVWTKISMIQKKLFHYSIPLFIHSSVAVHAYLCIYAVLYSEQNLFVHPDHLWLGLRKPGISAQITHVQKKVHFLVLIYDKQIL